MTNQQGKNSDFNSIKKRKTRKNTLNMKKFSLSVEK